MFMFERLTYAEAVRTEVSRQKRTCFGDSNVGSGTALWRGMDTPGVELEERQFITDPVFAYRGG